MATKALRGIHVFWWVTGFFAVTVALDAMFVVWAVQSFPGEQVKNSYVLGLDYNREVERREAQREMGWSAEVGISDEGNHMLVVRVKDHAASPVNGLQLAANVHVAGKRSDGAMSLIERSPGEYAAPIEVARGARLEVAISATRAASDTIIFEAAKKLEVS